MRPAGRLRVALFAVAAVLSATSVRAGSFTFDSSTNTYNYLGDLFNFCGYGCPEHAPGSADPVGVDFIIASLTFASPLPANLAFGDPVPTPTAWKMTDFLGAFLLSGVNSAPSGVPSEGVPGLVLSTNGSGDIVEYLMAAADDPNNFPRTSAVIVNPPIFCGEECAGGGLTDFVAVRERSDPDTEWDAGRIVPVPEPATLTLTGLGLAALVQRARRRRSR